MNDNMLEDMNSEDGLYCDTIQEMIHENKWDLAKIEEAAKGLFDPGVFFMYLVKIAKERQKAVENDWFMQDQYHYWRRIEQELLHIENQLRIIEKSSDRKPAPARWLAAQELRDKALTEKNTYANCRKYKAEFEALILNYSTRTSYLSKLINECEYKEIKWQDTAMAFHNNPKYQLPRGRKKKSR